MYYSIGHVLYVVLSKKNQVYPMQVVEIITKKSLSGEEISYILQAGAEKTSRISLDQVDGEVFDSSDEVRRVLIQRATNQVNRLVDAAIQKSSEWYGETENKNSIQTIKNLPDLAQASNQSLQEVTNSSFDEVESVVLPDGSVVKIKIPKLG